MSVEAYAAGIFDGEGCVLWYTRSAPSKRRCAVKCGVSVSNCDRRIHDFLVENFGGRIRVTTKNRRYRIGTWELESPGADEFLRRIRPYTILKSEQIDLFLAGRKDCFGHGHSRGGPKLKDIDICLREEYADAIRELKRPQWKEVSNVG